MVILAIYYVNYMVYMVIYMVINHVYGDLIR